MASCGKASLFIAYDFLHRNVRIRRLFLLRRKFEMMGNGRMEGNEQGERACAVDGGSGGWVAATATDGWG